MDLLELGGEPVGSGSLRRHYLSALQWVGGHALLLVLLRQALEELFEGGERNSFLVLVVIIGHEGFLALLNGVVPLHHLQLVRLFLLLLLLFLVALLQIEKADLAALLLLFLDSFVNTFVLQGGTVLYYVQVLACDYLSGVVVTPDGGRYASLLP